MIFNSKRYELPDQFKKSIEISRDIYQKLTRSDYTYEVQSKVSEEVFEIFLQYLIDGSEIEIHLGTIYEPKQLGQEFQISELLQKIDLKKKLWREIKKNTNNSK